MKAFRSKECFIAVFLLFCLVDDLHAARTSPDIGASVPTIDVELTPHKDAKGRADEIDVSYVFKAAHNASPPIEFTFDTLAPALLRTVDQVTRLHVTDANGEVSLEAPRIVNKDGGIYQVWTASRPTKGAINVAYAVPAAAAMTPKRGPHIDLQAAGNGLSGAFVSFMLLPDTSDQKALVTVHWHLPLGQSAISSYGDGDFHGAFDLKTFGNGLFLAGPIKRYLAGEKASGFGLYALGLQQDQLQLIAPWAAHAYEIERKDFDVTSSTAYRFLIRSYAGGPLHSGRSTDNAFMLYLPPGMDVTTSDLHQLVAHEMVHSLVKDFDDEPNGDGGLWYTEGTADYFSITLPYASGLYSPRQYLAMINAEAALYYTNALRATPDKQIPDIMWTGRNAWTVPYARGTLYFADLDAQLRAHGVKTTVLDLVNETSRRIRAGKPANEPTWQAVLKDRVGDWALADWRDMMSGKLLMPISGSFGECYVAKPIQVGLFDLGFKRPVRLTTGEVVSGVVKGSAAADAGLRDGDVITQTIDINPLYASFDSTIVIPVRRGNAIHTVTYNPRSGSEPGMMWAPRSGDPDHPCQIPKKPSQENAR